MNKQNKIGIIGLGLIGGSIALSLADKYTVYGYDNDKRVCAIASSNVCNVVNCVEDLRVCDIVFVCVPVFAMRDALRQARQALPDEVVIADVASVKAPFAGLIRGHVGTHPMAGTERGGIEQAKPHLFQNAYWVLTERGELAEKVKTVIADTGAIPLFMSAEEHDRAVAEFSHVPHAVAYALVTAATESGARPIAGSGFLDTTRIAQSDGKFWSTVFGLNANNIRRGIGAMISELSELDRMLDCGDVSELEKYFSRSKQKREALNKTDLGGEALYVDLVDRIGEFERITGAIARAGINVTNIALVAGREGASGALRLEFATAEERDRAAKVLKIDNGSK